MSSIENVMSAQQTPQMMASLQISGRREIAEEFETSNRPRAAFSSAREAETSGTEEKSDSASPFAPNADSAGILEAAVEAFNSRIDLSTRSTRFRISEETGDVHIQIIDNQSKEVIRSIPSEESLKIAARMRELAGNAVGVFVDTSS